MTETHTRVDRRRKYYLMVDVETANSSSESKLIPSQSLVYDIGAAIVDRNGNVFESLSVAVNEVFYDMADDVMQTAFYAQKLPQYHEDIANGKRQVLNFAQVKFIFDKWAKFYDIVAVVAHNARFDYTALNATQRYLSKSAYRYFLPYGIPIWDTMKMANDTICKEREYLKFCEELGYLTKRGQVRKTAEVLFQYISGDVTFKESHTGLEDVLIEKEIFSYCMKHHRSKEMRKELFNSQKESFPVYVKSVSGKKFRIGQNF